MTAKDVGKILREYREAKGWTIEDLVRTTRIKDYYLLAIEEGEFDVFVSNLQLKGFLRSYADAVELEQSVLFNFLDDTSATALEEIDAPLAEPLEQEEEEPEIAIAPRGLPPAPPPPNSEALFKEIGRLMAERRDSLGLSLDDVAQFTHIPPHHLTAIEQADFEQFPTPLQARGMLGIYAEFLEMNPERLMLRFAEGLQTQLAERQRAGETPARRNSQLRLGRGILLKNRWIPAWLRRIFSPDILTVTIVTALILVFISWGLGTVLLKADELVPQATAPGLAAALLPSATPAPSATPNVEASPTAIFIEDSEALPTEEFVLPEFNINQVQLFIITNQRAYLKVTVDGKVAFDGRVNAGANLPYTGNQSVEVLTGNAAAVQVFYNDRNMGTLGIFGEVVNLIYTLDGVVIPTSSAPPVTATSTPAGP